MTTIAEVGRLLLVTSTQPGPSVPVTMSSTDRALPFSTQNSLVTPAKRMIDSVGATAAWAAESVMIVALAKPPARNKAPLVGNLGLDLKRPADGVDRGIDPHDLALEGEFGLRRHRDAHRLAKPARARRSGPGRSS